MSEGYQLITDSSSDLPEEFLARENIISMPLTFVLDGKQYYCNQMEPSAFYAKMRLGSMPVTSQVNVKEATATFEPVLASGKDILYIAFSSGMSGTINSARIAAGDLQEKYPDRKIIVVDSLSVTLGQGLLVYFANEMKKAGASLEKVTRWVGQHALNIAHFVMTADLVHLHHGGRISKATTLIGTLLGIRPVIHLDDTGTPKLINGKRGTINALNSLVDHMIRVTGGRINQICCISHTDCEQEALYVKKRVQDKMGIREFIINQAGPVLGAHTGPDAIALCMLANHR